MKIHFLKEDALAALKSNIPGNMEHYREETNEWIYRYFDDEDPFMEFQVPVGDIELTFNKDESDLSISELDVEAAKKLYLAMKDISTTQATDERLWAGLCHGECWGYLHDRWKKSKLNGEPLQVIKSRYFFGQGARRSLFTNSLSRLWWVARMLYDENRSDPFELLEYFKNGFYSKTIIVFSSNYTNCPNVLYGLISALIVLKKEGNMGMNDEEMFTIASRYVSVLGGTHILDFYSEEEIREKILRHMRELPTKKKKEK